jgi:hypothetical protein
MHFADYAAASRVINEPNGNVGRLPAPHPILMVGNLTSTTQQFRKPYLHVSKK